jgi:MFS family permease
VAGLVISLIGTPAAFFLNAVSYGAVMMGLKIMRPAELRPAERVERAKGQLREGLAYVWSRPDLLMTMVLIFFVATFGMNFGVTTALMSKVVFHTGAGRFGIASAVFALGALIGALYAARRKKAGMRLLVVTALAFSLLEIACGFMPTYWLFLVVLVPTGLTVISLSTAANASIQLGTPAEMRGRVMGIYMLVFLGGAPLGAPLTGWLAQEIGIRLSMAAGGVVSAIAAVAVGLMVARYRGVPMRSYLRQTRMVRALT